MSSATTLASKRRQSATSRLRHSAATRGIDCAGASPLRNVFVILLSRMGVTAESMRLRAHLGQIVFRVYALEGPTGCFVHRSA